MNIIRHTSTRMHRQHSLSNTIIRVTIRLIKTRRIKRHIVRQTRVEISFIIRHTKRRARTLPHLSHQTHRSSTTGAPILRHTRHLNRNRMNLTHTNQTSHRNSNINIRNISMNSLPHHLNARKLPNHRDSSTKCTELTHVP